MSWKPVGSNLNLLPEDAANVRACVEFRGKLYIFGGDSRGNDVRGIEGRAEALRSNTLVEVCTFSEQLIQYNCDSVPGRFLHSAILHMTSGQPEMVIFGGVGSDDTILSDCWSLNLQHVGTHSWQPIRCQGEVRPRASHTAVEWDGGMWVFGGMDACYSWKEYRDLDAFDVLDLENFEWIPVMPTGPSPSARMDHSCAVHQDCMYIFGGSTENRMRYSCSCCCPTRIAVP